MGSSTIMMEATRIHNDMSGLGNWDVCVIDRSRDLHGTKKHLDSGSEEQYDVGSYIISGLMGIFKGGMVERYQLTHVSSNMDLGMEIRKWVVLLIVALGKKRHQQWLHVPV